MMNFDKYHHDPEDAPVTAKTGGMHEKFCAGCGKYIIVLHPSTYLYKKNSPPRFYCTNKCWKHIIDGFKYLER